MKKAIMWVVLLGLVVLLLGYGFSSCRDTTVKSQKGAKPTSIRFDGYNPPKHDLALCDKLFRASQSEYWNEARQAVAIEAIACYLGVMARTETNGADK